METNIQHSKNDVFEEFFKDKYIPNPLENFQSFINKKKAALAKKSAERILDVSVGILIFSLVCKNNQKFKKLFDNYITFWKENSSFLPLQLNDKEMEAKIEEGKEEIKNRHKRLGLEENDFEELIKLADETKASGQILDAVNMYKALTFIFPLHLRAWLAWANAQSKHSFEYQKVLEIYQDCLILFNMPIVHISIAICHFKADQPDLAKMSLNEAITLSEEHGELDMKATASRLLHRIETIY